MNDEKKKLPLNGFFFKENPKLKDTIRRITLLMIPFFSFFVIVGGVNMLLYFYTISKLLIFVNFFVLVGLSSFDLTPIENFLQQKKLQKSILKRRLVYMIVYNVGFYLLEYLVLIVFFRNVLISFTFSNEALVLRLIIGIGCLSILVGILSYFFVVGVFYQIQEISNNSGRFSINNQKIKEKLVLIAIYGFLSLFGFFLTTTFFTNDPESNLFLLYVDFGVIFILGLIFWVFGLKSLRNHNFEFPIKSEVDEKKNLEDLKKKIEIDKQF